MSWLKRIFGLKDDIDFEALFDKYSRYDVGEDLHDVHLVASGSGVKLFVFLLAIYVLHMLGYRFVKGTGTSGGAIIIASLFARYDPNSSRERREQALRSLVTTAIDIDIPRLLDPSLAFFRLPFKLIGMIKGKKMLNRFRVELPRSFDDLHAPVEVAAFQCNLVDPRTRLLRSGDLPLAVRASMSIPFVFSPVWYQGMLLVDGGWQMNIPLPDGGKNVIGLTFGTGQDTTIEEVKNNIELGFKLLDGAMDEGMRRAVEEAPDAELITLENSIGGLDFFVSDENKIQGMVDGADSVLRWAINK